MGTIGPGWGVSMNPQIKGEFHRTRTGYTFQVYGSGAYSPRSNDLSSLYNSLKQSYVCKEPVVLFSDITDEPVGTLYPANDPACRYYNLSINGDIYHIRASAMRNVMSEAQAAAEIFGERVITPDASQTTLLGVV